MAYPIFTEKQFANEFLPDNYEFVKDYKTKENCYNYSRSELRLKECSRVRESVVYALRCIQRFFTPHKFIVVVPTYNSTYSRSACSRMVNRTAGFTPFKRMKIIDTQDAINAAKAGTLKGKRVVAVFEQDTGSYFLAVPSLTRLMLYSQGGTHFRFCIYFPTDTAPLAGYHGYQQLLSSGQLFEPGGTWSPDSTVRHFFKRVREKFMYGIDPKIRKY